jgi:polysaccharide export outer membrane protein
MVAGEKGSGYRSRTGMKFPLLLGIRALACVSLLVASAGCAGGTKMTVPSGAMYERGALEEFVNQTGPPIGPTPNYRIGIGDKLDVVFLYHTNLSSREILVRDDGRISLPYVGDQEALGYTPMELDSILTIRFSEILKQPNISVILNAPAPKQVYVLGFVERPGGYDFQRPLSLLSALARAGGVKKGGKATNTVLIRRAKATEVVGIEIDVEAIMNGSAIHNDLLLKNYDIVYVPQSRLSSTAEFAETLGKIINVPVGTVLDGWQLANSIEQYKFFRDRNSEGFEEF